MTRVVVTGMGAISPAGHNVAQLWNAVVEGTSSIGPITAFDTTDYQAKIAAEVKGFDPDAHFGPKVARRMDRFIQFAVYAAQQAVADARLEINENNADRTCVVVGSGVGGMGTLLDQVRVLDEKGPRRVSPLFVPMMLTDSAAGQVAIELGARGPNLAVVSACASGANAIGEAAEIIRRGAADIALCGGTEAAIVTLAVAAFSVMGALSTENDDPAHACRPFDATRGGFVMGEGAGILVLESEEHARARGATVLAALDGYGATADAYHIVAPIEDGRGAAKSMQAALQSAGISPAEVDYINAHGTGTKLNDLAETRAIKAVFGDHAYHIPVSSTKPVTGHLLGAAGAIEAIICIKAMQEGLIPGTLNLSHPDPECDLDYVPAGPRQAQVRTVLTNSFGFGGHNATLVFRAA
ncbi:MAG: beta-ketoacyl-ACP synthase II [Chloroflexi bacterium]|nr:beta-ketoacyl-ACP synthase II [Chloroflexota bacterium]